MDVTIDKAGRVVIPKPMRDALGLTDGSILELVFVDGELIMHPKPVDKRLEQRGGRVVLVAAERVEPLSADDVRDALESSRR